MEGQPGLLLPVAAVTVVLLRPVSGARCAARPWGPCLVGLVSLVGGYLLAGWRAGEINPLWRELPPREVTGVLEVRDVFHPRRPEAVAGTGRILETNLPFDTLTGERTAFYLRRPAGLSGSPGIGQRLAFTGVLHHLPHETDPDGFERYLLRRNIRLNLNAGTVLGAEPPPAPERLRLALYRISQDRLTTGSRGPEDPGWVLGSMLLGNRSLLSDARLELFRNSGTVHLFAVSGLHVGSFALCLHLLSRLLRMPAAARVLPVLAGTWTYVWLTGASPSAVRAGIMVTCVFLSRHLLRQPHLFPAMVLSAWLVLLYDPRQIRDLGFQLSYGVVAALLLIGLPLVAALRNWQAAGDQPVPGGPRWPRFLSATGWRLAELLCVSTSAALASMPLIVQHFSLFTPGGLLFSVILNPLAAACVMIGCLTLLTAFLPLPLEWLACLSWPVIFLMENLLRICLEIPGTYSHRNWDWPPTGTILLLVALGLAWGIQRLRQEGRSLPVAAQGLPLVVLLGGLALTSVHP